MATNFEQNAVVRQNGNALGAIQVIANLAKLSGWKLHGDGDDVAIEKTFVFDNFAQTMAFANAVAFVAQQQNHAPELLVCSGGCSVRWRSDELRGIGLHDFRCAALVDALFQSE